MRRLRLKCFVGVTLAAALLTLLTTYPVSYLNLHQIPTTPHTPTHHLDTLADTLIDTGGEEKAKWISTNHTTNLTKSQAEIRVEAKVEDVLVSQEVVQAPPPKEWVEVRKIKQKGTGKVRGRKREAATKKKDVSKVKVLGKTRNVLKERALAFPETSPLRSFLREQERRSQHIATTCRSFQPSLSDIIAGSRGPPAGLLSIKHLIYDRINQVTFCPVYKAASTSWSLTLMQLGRVLTKKNRGEPLQKLIKMFYPKISGLGAAKITEDTTHFMVVRHPLGRLLSCYCDKYENATKDFYYHAYGEKIVKRYRPALQNLGFDKILVMQNEVRRALKKGGPINLPNNPFANPLGPTFPEFAEHVAATKFDDEHWRPYVTHCAPCSLPYDFVLRFESLEEENKWFLEYLNRSGEVKPRWDNHNLNGNTKRTPCNYFNQLLLHQIDRLVDKYKKDMLLYEYDAEEYRKCAKDYVAVEGEKKKKDGGGSGGGGGVDVLVTTTTEGDATTTTTTIVTTSGGAGDAS